MRQTAESSLATRSLSLWERVRVRAAVSNSLSLWERAGVRAAVSAVTLCLATAACGPGIPGEIIATTEAFSQGLAQSEDRLFWFAGDKVYALPKDGGEPETLADGQKALALSVAGDEVCWVNRADDYAIRCAPASGGEVRTLGSQPLEEYTVRAPAFDGQNLYWSTSGGRIRRVPLAGGEVTDVATVESQASTLVAEPGVLYASIPGGIVRIAEGATEPEQIISGAVVTPTSLSLSNPPDDFLYWTEIGARGDDGLILRGPKTPSGGDVALLARRQTLPSQLDVQDGVIWWATGGGTDDIRRVPVDGGRVNDFASGDDKVGPPVVDGQSVYWIDQRGSVLRAAK